MRAIVGLVLLGAAAGAGAQTSFAVGAVSDYQIRGVSYSDGRPSAWVSVNHDFDAGWFAGATAARARFSANGANLYAQAVAGYAARLGTRLSWELGANQVAFRGSARNWNYKEAFAGLAFDDLTLRLHYAPRYLGTERRAWYVETSLAWPLADNWDLSVHGGHRTLSGVATYGQTAREQSTDLRVGLAYRSGPWSLWAAWRAQRGQYGTERAARGLATGLTRVF